MTATYFRHGAGRSLNGRHAENEGKEPLTRAVKTLAALGGITQREAREVFAAIGPCEWHHVGKFASACDYYSVAAGQLWLACRDDVRRLPRFFKESINATASGARIEGFGRLAAEWGVDANVLGVAYYGSWNSTAGELVESDLPLTAKGIAAYEAM